MVAMSAIGGAGPARCRRTVIPSRPPSSHGRNAARNWWRAPRMIGRGTDERFKTTVMQCYARSRRPMARRGIDLADLKCRIRWNPRSAATQLTSHIRPRCPCRCNRSSARLRSGSSLHGKGLVLAFCPQHENAHQNRNCKKNQCPEIDGHGLICVLTKFYDNYHNRQPRHRTSPYPPASPAQNHR